jgi:hypothetical protein
VQGLKPGAFKPCRLLERLLGRLLWVNCIQLVQSLTVAMSMASTRSSMTRSDRQHASNVRSIVSVRRSQIQCVAAIS